MEFWEELSASCGDAVAEEIEALLRRRVHGEVAASDIEMFTTDVDRQRVTVDAAAPHTWAWINKLANVTNIRAALDLGCGGGVATCFLALDNPGARVVGVDSNITAIRTARQLAIELDLRNIEFIAAPIDGLDLGESFDFVTSSAVWAESETWVHTARWWSSVNQLPMFLKDGQQTSRLAEAAARHLDVDGVYLSLERCRDLAGLAAWIGEQQRTGLNFDANISDMITIDGVLTGPERLPMVATHRGALAAGVHDLVQWRLRVGDTRLDESLMVEMVMSGGGDWTMLRGQIFEASEDDADFSAALLLLERGDEGKLYFSTTRGVREILASSPDGGAEQFVPLYRRMRDHLSNRQSVVRRRDATVDDLVVVLPRLADR
jgi:SAM-dependent methyltransferase